MLLAEEQPCETQKQKGMMLVKHEDKERDVGMDKSCLKKKDQH